MSDVHEKMRKAVQGERERLQALLEKSERGEDTGDVEPDLVAKHLNELDVILAKRGLDMIEHVDLPKLDRWLTHAAEELRHEKD